MEGGGGKDEGDMTDGEENECRDERRDEHSPCGSNPNEDAVPDEGSAPCRRDEPYPPEVCLGGFYHLWLVCQNTDNPSATAYI